MKKLLTLSILALFAGSAMAEEPKPAATGTPAPAAAPAKAPKKGKRVRAAKVKKGDKSMDKPANATK